VCDAAATGAAQEVEGVPVEGNAATETISMAAEARTPFTHFVNRSRFSPFGSRDRPCSISISEIALTFTLAWL